MSRDDILGATIGGARSYKRKSNKGWWGALVVLMGLASVVAGFHFGGQRLLKHHADRQAVESVSLPVPTEEQAKVTAWKVKGHGETLEYKFLIFPNGLECLDKGHHTPTCNWEKFNAEREHEPVS